MTQSSCTVANCPVCSQLPEQEPRRAARPAVADWPEGFDRQFQPGGFVPTSPQQHFVEGGCVRRTLEPPRVLWGGAEFPLEDVTLEDDAALAFLQLMEDTLDEARKGPADDPISWRGDVLATPRGHALANGERQAVYGPPIESFTRIGRIWGALLDLDDDIDAETVAIMLSGMKLSRLIASPGHVDSQDDVEGYIEALRLVLQARQG